MVTIVFISPIILLIDQLQQKIIHSVRGKLQRLDPGALCSQGVVDDEQLRAPAHVKKLQARTAIHDGRQLLVADLDALEGQLSQLLHRRDLSRDGEGAIKRILYAQFEAFQPRARFFDDLKYLATDAPTVIQIEVL